MKTNFMIKEIIKNPFLYKALILQGFMKVSLTRLIEKL